jgi:hypothetical protein
MEVMINAYKILIENTNGREYLEDKSTDWILKWIINK